MKVTGTFQIRKTNLYPCPPLPVLHTPSRKVKSEQKHRDWRVNPIARGTTQHQRQNRPPNSSTSSSPETSSSHSSNKTTQHNHQERTSNSTPSSPVISRSSNNFGSSGTPMSSPNQQNTQRTTLQRQKFDGVRKIQYINMNMRFANLTMALNSGYQKTQEQAEKRLRMEQTVKENSGQIMSC